MDPRADPLPSLGDSMEDVSLSVDQFWLLNYLYDLMDLAYDSLEIVRLGRRLSWAGQRAVP